MARVYLVLRRRSLCEVDLDLLHGHGPPGGEGAGERSGVKIHEQKLTRADNNYMVRSYKRAIGVSPFSLQHNEQCRSSLEKVEMMVFSVQVMKITANFYGSY